MRKWRHGDVKTVAQKTLSELQNQSLFYMAVIVQFRILGKVPMCPVLIMGWPELL